MKYFRWLAFFVLIGCNESGELPIPNNSTWANNSDVWNYLTSSHVNWVINTSEKVYESGGTNGLNFSSIEVCSSKNFLQIDRENYRILMTNSLSGFEQETQLYAFSESKYFLLVIINEIENRVYNVYDFYDLNNVLFLATKGQDDIYSFSPILPLSQSSVIEVCVSANQININFHDLWVERLGANVSGEFRSPMPTRRPPG